YDRCARSGMQRSLAEVRLPLRIGSNLVAYALKLPATNVLEVLPLRPVCRSLVEIDWNLVAAPNLLADLPRNGDAILEPHALNRNERDYVGGAKSGMRSLMLIQIDQLGCFSHATDRSFGDGFAIANQSDHAAIVIGIHLSIEQIDAVDLHRLDNRINFLCIAPFRKIRDTLDQR